MATYWKACPDGLSLESNIGGLRIIIDRAMLSVVVAFRWYVKHGDRVARHARKNERDLGSSHSILLHHEVIGKPPAGHVVDHVNGNAADNRMVNLRFISGSLNSSRGGHGVAPEGKWWVAHFQHDKKRARKRFLRYEDAVAWRAARMNAAHGIESLSSPRTPTA